MHIGRSHGDMNIRYVCGLADKIHIAHFILKYKKIL